MQSANAVLARPCMPPAARAWVFALTTHPARACSIALRGSRVQLLSRLESQNVLRSTMLPERRNVGPSR